MKQLLTLTRSAELTNGFECRSETFGVTASSIVAEEAVNFVKGSVLAAIGMRQHIPNELTVTFSIDRTALVDVPFCSGLGCGVPPSWECRCVGCLDGWGGRFWCCSLHRERRGVWHDEVRGNPALWVRL